MNDDLELSHELAWRDDGHVSDLVITALGDGERSLVPLEAYTHVHRCAACGERLGEAALVAMLMDEALQPESCPPARASAGALAEATLAERSREALATMAATAEAPPPSSGRRLPLPVPAVAAALVLALVGAAPSAAALVTELPQIVAAGVERIPGLVRTVAVLLRAALATDGSTVTVVWAVAGAVLLACGLLVTRLLPLESKGETS